MPLPIGEGLTIVPSMGDVLRSIQTQQESIKHIQLENESLQVNNSMKQVLMGLTQQKTDLLKRQVESSDAFMKAQQAVNSEVGKQSSDATDPTVTRDPTKSQPTPSPAAQELIDLSPGERNVRDLQSQMAKADKMVAQADYFAAGGAPEASKRAQELRTERNNIRTQLREAINQMHTQQREDAQDVGNILNSVSDTASLRAAFPQIAKIMGVPKARQLALSLPADENGLPVYNPDTQKALKPIIAQAEKVHEQKTDTINVSRLVQAEEENQRKREKDEFDRKEKAAADIRADKDVAMRREGLNLREEELSLRRQQLGATANNRDLAIQQKIENKAQDRLNKDENTQKFAAMQQSYETARNTLNKLKVYGIRGVDTAEVKAAQHEYDQMVNHYRSLAGGKYTDEQKKEFDSLLSRGTAFFATIGLGNQSTTRTIESISAEVERMYNGANAAMVKRTLQEQDKVWGKGADPTVITSRANRRQVINSGLGTEVTDKDGVRWMVFQGGDAYPIRDKQKPRRDGEHLPDEE